MLIIIKNINYALTERSRREKYSYLLYDVYTSTLKMFMVNRLEATALIRLSVFIA